MEKMSNVLADESGGQMSQHPTELEVTTAFGKIIPYLNDFGSQTNQKRERRGPQLKVTTMARLLREREGTGERKRPFKPRKRQKIFENK